MKEITFTRGSLTYTGTVIDTWTMGTITGYTVQLEDGSTVDITDTQVVA